MNSQRRAPVINRSLTSRLWHRVYRCCRGRELDERACTADLNSRYFAGADSRDIPALSKVATRSARHSAHRASGLHLSNSSLNTTAVGQLIRARPWHMFGGMRLILRILNLQFANKFQHHRYARSRRVTGLLLGVPQQLLCREREPA